jgi:hypothetical protein
MQEPTEASFVVDRIYAPDEPIPAHVRDRVRALFVSPNTVGQESMFWDLTNIKRILKGPQQSTQQFNDVLSVVVRECGFWFRAYTRPLPRATLTQQLQFGTIREQLMAATEICLEDIMRMHWNGSFEGLEVLSDHEVGNTKGYVVESRVDAEGSLDLLIRPFDNRMGKELVNQILFCGKRSCSLSHTRYRDKITLNELSICMQGARPETTLRQMVELKKEQQTPKMTSRFYQTRIQCKMSKSQTANLALLPIEYNVPDHASCVTIESLAAKKKLSNFSAIEKQNIFQVLRMQQGRLKRRKLM